MAVELILVDLLEGHAPIGLLADFVLQLLQPVCCSRALPFVGAFERLAISHALCGHGQERYAHK